MVLVLHVIFALSSVLQASYSLISPSRPKIQASTALTALTLATGTYLVVKTHAGLLQACFSGLLYLSLVSIMLALAHRKLVDNI